MTDSEKFVILFEPASAFYRYLEVIRSRGFKSLVLSGNREACLAGEQRYNQSLGRPPVSLIDAMVVYRGLGTDDLLQSLSSYQGKVAGVLAGGEDYFVPVAAELGRALGFDSTLQEDAVCQNLKTAMKRRLVERGIATPNFAIAQNIDEAISVWKAFGRDCMVKMVDFTNSLNVFRVKNEGQLRNAWSIITENRRGVETPFGLSREVILEEFVGGRELTVEGYAQGGRVEVLNFSKKLTEDNFIVVGHYIPALVSETEVQALDGIAHQCVSALGVRNSVFHAEVHLAGGAPYIIECAARPPGQHTVDLIDKSYGIDLMAIGVDLAVGRKVDVSRVAPRRHYAILALYTKVSGYLDHFEGIEELDRLGGVLHVHLGAEKGDHVERLETYKDKYGFIVVESDSPHDLRDKARWIRENVRMCLTHD